MLYSSINGVNVSKYILLAVICLLMGCGRTKNDLKLVPVKEEAFKQYINDKSLPDDPNLTLDKTIVNNQYPIEIALYSDHQFYYHLANLGAGVGTWEYNDGRLELSTKRKILNMNVKMDYKIHAIDDAATAIIVDFEDRFGVNMLKVKKVNWP